MRLYLYVLMLLVLLPLFFVNLPFDHASRSFNAFWDQGHIFFFMFFVRILASRQAAKGFSWAWVLKVLGLVLAVGIFVEIVQYGLAGHSSSWQDVGRDLGGGIIGLAWVYWRIVTRKQRWMLLAVVSSVVVISTIPLVVSLVDEVLAKSEFPLLASFETERELSRWQAKTDISRVENPVRKGRFALRLPLTTDTYSGIGLKYFPGNWRGMKGLKLSVYNPEFSSLKLTFRIHDRFHTQGEQVYSDRFNRSLPMQPGWNDVFIGMDDVKNAPKDREMDLGAIDGFGLFASYLKGEQIIYLDDVHLVGY